MVDQMRLPASGAHVFVDDVAAPMLRASDQHHLRRVLRLRDGESITVSDGIGAWRRCRIEGETLCSDGELHRQPRAVPQIAVAFSILKGDRSDWIVQKLAELGVDRIVPVSAARGVLRWDAERAGRQVERWRSIAHGAAMQSRRAWLAAVDDVTEGAALADALPGLVFAHPGGSPPSLNHPMIAVGPEGGWSPEEIAQAVGTVDLGPTTLRAETAAVSAAALLTALRSGLVTAVRPEST